jgi:ribulose-5-phosphate 4-epimerase/fuculose-1-phosphate aldolase
VADNIPDAFVFLYLFESTCAIQVKAQGAGELIPIDQRIIDGAQAQAKQATRGLGGALAWPGLLRRLDKADPSYKE